MKSFCVDKFHSFLPFVSSNQREEEHSFFLGSSQHLCPIAWLDINATSRSRWVFPLPFVLKSFSFLPARPSTLLLVEFELFIFIFLQYQVSVVRVIRTMQNTPMTIGIYIVRSIRTNLQPWMYLDQLKQLVSLSLLLGGWRNNLQSLQMATLRSS